MLMYVDCRSELCVSIGHWRVLSCFHT